MQIENALLDILNHGSQRYDLSFQMSLGMNNLLQVLILNKSVCRLPVEGGFSWCSNQGGSTIRRDLRGRRNNMGVASGFSGIG